MALIVRKKESDNYKLSHIKNCYRQTCPPLPSEKTKELNADCKGSIETEK